MTGKKPDKDQKDAELKKYRDLVMAIIASCSFGSDCNPMWLFITDIPCIKTGQWRRPNSLLSFDYHNDSIPALSLYFIYNIHPDLVLYYDKKSFQNGIKSTGS